MPSDSGATTSLWMATTDLLPCPELTEDARADVCIVGAGIAGLTTAYHLAQEGRSVVVLDDGPIGGGETCRTSAHLSDVIDDRFQVLERLLGADGPRGARASHAAAIDCIEAIVLREGIECAFERVDGYLFLAPGQERALLDREEEEWMRARFRDAGAVELRWSGQVLETLDGLAFIGRNPHDADNVFVATGDSGMGLTHGTLAGMLLPDLIAGRENPGRGCTIPHASRCARRASS